MTDPGRSNRRISVTSEWVNRERYVTIHCNYMLLLKSIGAGLLAAVASATLWLLVVTVLPLLAFGYLYEGDRLLYIPLVTTPLELLMVLMAALAGFTIGFLWMLSP